jgi:hypothetical protein
VAAETKQNESMVHSSLKNHFQKFNKLGWDTEDINPDIFNINVTDSNEVNIPDRFPTVYAHQFTLEVDFKRFESEDVDAIETVNETITVEQPTSLLYWGDGLWGNGTW